MAVTGGCRRDGDINEDRGGYGVSNDEVGWRVNGSNRRLNKS